MPRSNPLRLLASLAFRLFGLAADGPSRPDLTRDDRCWAAVIGHGWDVIRMPDGDWAVSDEAADILADGHDDPRDAVDEAAARERAEEELRLFEGHGEG